MHYDLKGAPYNKDIALKDALYAGYGHKSSFNNLKKAGYNLDKELSTHNHQVYYNDNNKNLVVNVVGTHNLNDIKTDVNLLLGNLKSTQRYKSAKKTVEKAKFKYNKKNGVNIVGHSLGGSIAQHIADKNDRVITYNKGATFGQKNNKNETAYRNVFDVPSLPAALNKNVKNLPLTLMNSGTISSHSINNLPQSIKIK